MVWEWSHCAEAYDYARDYLSAKFSLETLAEIAAEWDTHEKAEAEKDDENALDFDAGFYRGRVAVYKTLPKDVVAEYVWKKMEELRNCDNGGHKFWGCPYGCGIHKVPASPKDC